MAGQRIEVRMGRKGVGERALERIVRNGAEIIRQLDRKTTGLHQGPDFPGMAEDIGVDGFLLAVARAGGRGLAQRGRDWRRADPAVPVPMCFPAAQPNAGYASPV